MSVGTIVLNVVVVDGALTLVIVVKCEVEEMLLDFDYMGRD